MVNLQSSKHLPCTTSFQARRMKYKVNIVALAYKPNLYFITSECVFLKEKIKVSFIQQIKKIVYIRAILPIVSDRHDKPFCTKAIAIIDNFKKALGYTDNR